jgi:hypothetical protein
MVVMKKSTIKLTSALLMLNLISTSLYAATSLDENVAANRITRLIRLSVDKKLNQMMDAIVQEEDAIEQEEAAVSEAIEKDSAYAERSIRESLVRLKNHNDLKSIAGPLIIIYNAKDLDTTIYLQEYQAYLESQIAGSSPIRKQWISYLKAMIVDNAADQGSKLDNMESLLQETINSLYPFFRWESYKTLSRASKYSGDIDQAFAYLIKGLSLPKVYHAQVYWGLVDLDSSEGYKPKREFFLKSVIKAGKPEEKAKALDELARLYNGSNSRFYKPEEAIRIYESLLENIELISFFNPYSIRSEIACILNNGPDEIKDQEKAIDLYEQVLSNKEKVTKGEYEDAVEKTILFYSLVAQNPTRAFHLAQEALENSKFSEDGRKRIECSLVGLYKNGPEGIKNHQKALQLLEKLTADPSDPDYFLHFSSLVGLLRHGDFTVKDAHRAIEICERALQDHNFSEKNCCFIKELLVNIYLYSSEDVRNPSKAVLLLEELSADVNNSNRFSHLKDLAYLLDFGDVTVRNVERSIQALEELRNYEKSKLSALERLSYIYRNNQDHKDLSKLAGCYRELILLHADKPLEQIKSLTNLLGVYVTEEALNIEEAKVVAQQILDHHAVDGTARLQVQVLLSDLYNNHPEAAVTPEERTRVHEELTNNPMATPSNVGDAQRRLIAAYLEQQNFEQVVTTYEHFLTRAVDWQRRDVVNEYIVFLENQDHEFVHNPERLAELQALVLPQVPGVMAENIHHLPGVVAGFGGAGHIDPYFSPEMIANRKASLLALSGDSFDQANYQTNLERTVAEIKEAIAHYSARDTEFAATAAVATEVFETGNINLHNFRSVVNHLEYSFSYDGDTRTMTYGEALVRIWARITHHPEANYLKDLIIVQLAAARDPDGHIVCEVGKITRHFQAMEGHFSDIRAVNLSLRDIFSHFAGKEQKLIDALPAEHPLKILESKEIREAGEYKVDADVSSWVKPEYLGKFGSLSNDEQTLLNDHYEQMVLKFEQELLKSRDTLSEAEKAFARREVGNYWSMTWFMG